MLKFPKIRIKFGVLMLMRATFFFILLSVVFQACSILQKPHGILMAVMKDAQTYMVCALR